MNWYSIIPQLQKWDGLHDCAPSALTRVVPALSFQSIRKAFSLCCGRWPNAGVTNKEFNIVLRYLELFERFEYTEPQDALLNDYLVDKNTTHILLLWGHFTVTKNGQVIEPVKQLFFRYPPDEIKVICAWRLLS